MPFSFFLAILTAIVVDLALEWLLYHGLRK